MKAIISSAFFAFLLFCYSSFFFSCRPLNSPLREEAGERMENDMYDGPDKAALFEMERTKDPATGKVPRERLLAALDRTAQSKRENTSLLGGLPWVERGPNADLPGPYGNSRANNDGTSGRIRAVMVDSTDPTHKTVWVGGVSGGLWKTTDITAYPSSWNIINEDLSNLAIAAICQDPRPGFQNIMYFCTGESYYNIDAVRGNGVFKSTDYGETWTWLSSTSSYVNGTRILCDYQGNIYLATRGTGLLRSTAASGGAAWTNITPSGFSNSDITDLEISSTGAAGRLHVTCGAFSANGYRYTDIPATVTSVSGWNASTTALPSYNNRIEIACSGNTLYALPANNDPSNQVPAIYKSTDGGVNWAATASVPSSTWASGQGWYALALDIDPSNANNCIIGGLDTWKTTNGGTSWTQLSTWVGTSSPSQYVHADVHKIVWIDGGNKLIFASDGGVFYSSDKGTTIRDRNNGLRIKQFYSCALHPSTTNYFLAGAQDNGVHQFTNAGLSSTTEVNGGDGCFVAIDQIQPLNQFGSYVYNIYNRSTDGGSTWGGVAFYKGTNGAPVNFGSFINAWDFDNTNKIIYAGGEGGEFFRWTTALTTASGSYYLGGTPSFPAGASIQTGITGFNAAKVTAVTVSPYTANRVYFGTAGGRVVYIDNANTAASGAAGTNITGASFPAGTVSCINTGTDDQNLICCFSNYGVSSVWVSANGGTSWTSLDNNGVNLADMPVRWCMFYPGDNTRAFIATETGVWQTDLINGTSTIWTANPTFPSVRTDMIKYRSSDRTLAAATHGRGLWTTVLPTAATADVSFQTSATTVKELTSFTSSCRGYTDYTGYMVITNPSAGAATVTLSVAGGATATQGADYDVTTNGSFSSPSMTLNFSSGSGTPQPFKIRVYDDNATESAESFTLNYSLSGGSAVAGASNQTFTFTINDNDAAPVPGGSVSATIGAYTLNSSAVSPFQNNLTKFRIQHLFKASELVSAGFTSAAVLNAMTLRVVTKNSAQPYTGFTIAMANVGVNNLSGGFVNPSFTQVYSNNYSTVVGDNVFNFSTPFNWDGVSNVLVNFCFSNAAAGASADVVEATSNALGSTVYASTYSNTTTGTACSLPAALISTSRIKAKFDGVVTPTAISTSLSSSRTAYLGPNDDVYFYDASGNIMARIKNLSAGNYGCTQVVIDRAGSSAEAFWNPASSGYLASKTFKIIPTYAVAGNLQVTLYYTSAEILGYNTAASPSVFSGAQIVKVGNGYYIPDITPATPHFTDANPVVMEGTVAAFGTTGSTITATFNSFANAGGFGVGKAGNSALTADYRTRAGGNYSNSAIWEYNILGSNYINATQAPAASSNVTIQNVNTVTLDASQTINSGKTLTVDGTLKTGTNNISGAGNFLLTAIGTLSTSNSGTNGLSQNIAVTGTKTFTDGANYTFLGATTAPFGSNFTSVKSDNVVIGANITLDKPLYINNTLGFTGSNRTLTTAGNLTIGSTAANTAMIPNLTKDITDGVTTVSGNSISGQVTVERYIANAGHRAWHLLSGKAVTGTQTIYQTWQESGATGVALPNYGTWITSTLYNGSNGFDATNQNLSSIITHNQGGAGGPSWNYNLANTNVTQLAANQGYMLFVRGDRNYTPTLPSPTATSATTLRTRGTLQQGTLSAVSVSATGTGRTLVGNPYASPIDMDPIFTATANLNQDMYVWDPTLTGNYGVGGFRLVERNGGNYRTTPVVAGGTTLDAESRYIHSGQAFFLKATGSSANVVFTESAKAGFVSAVNPIVPTGITDQQLFVNLMLVNPGEDPVLADGIRVAFSDNYDAALTDDIEKMGNFGENISSYRGSRKWIVEKRPLPAANDTIFLRTSNTTARTYRLQIGSIDFTATGITAILQDTYLGTETVLSLAGDISNYDFRMTDDPASASPDRFRVIFRKSGISTIAVADKGIRIIPNPARSNNLQVAMDQLDKGTYLFRLISSNGQVVYKESVAFAGGSSLVKLNTGSGIGAGVYQLEIIGPDRKRYVRSLSVIQ